MFAFVTRDMCPMIAALQHVTILQQMIQMCVMDRERVSTRISVNALVFTLVMHVNFLHVMASKAQVPSCAMVTEHVLGQTLVNVTRDTPELSAIFQFVMVLMVHCLQRVMAGVNVSLLILVDVPRLPLESIVRLVRPGTVVKNVRLQSVLVNCLTTRKRVQARASVLDTITVVARRAIPVLIVSSRISNVVSVMNSSW